MKAVKIPLKELNNTKNKLMEYKNMNMNYKIKTDSEYGYIPINNENEIKNLEVVDIELDKLNTYPKNFTEFLEDKLTENEIEDLKKSFDIIGDIVILEIPENLINHKIAIGKAALDFTKRKSVYMKKSAIKGQTRTRELELLSGIPQTVTTHKEHGLRLKLDVEKVYFSPRLATERKRIADEVTDGEKILDMFCGIGPFPIIIAKEKNVDIVAVDINEIAIEYLNKNIELNKLKGTISPITGDINNVVSDKLQTEKFDRIIMNLPGTAYEFLDLAISLIKDNGIINYYEFSDSYGQGIERIQKAANKKNKKVEIKTTRKVKSSSPGMWHIAIDAKITS
ncbi:class I SAM-dependent methyltransferase family protein [Methanobrevibacter sp. OttesenSCG-928-K11]|nr:class I SAM-dependent methyltransferase family protein [Methanobrevibacter sp. OttesenSCG-928-K11]MDL2270838.1 class I SAM-dependent methyltransferase family protein [Methanobrevibacter sp. OttesenSCG-928-I08]